MESKVVMLNQLNARAMASASPGSSVVSKWMTSGRLVAATTCSQPDAFASDTASGVEGEVNDGDRVTSCQTASAPAPNRKVTAGDRVAEVPKSKLEVARH